MIYYYLRQFFTPKVFSTLLLILFLTQFVYVEGYSISYLKVGFMALCPIVLIVNGLKISRALVLALVYFVYIFITAYFHPNTFRFSTIGYLGLFLMMYVTFYTFVFQGAFKLDYYIKVIRTLLLAYSFCLITQQLCVVIGIRFLPLINLNYQFFLSINKLPSLSIEPSHSARIMGALYYAYLKCNEYKKQEKIGLESIFSQEHRYVVILFLWTMLTMGSGTAFICLGVLSLYFMKGFQFFYAIPIFALVYFLLSISNNTQFERARNIVVATASVDSKQVMDEDGSAAVRILPLLNTLKLDYSNQSSWFGEGCDSGRNKGLYSSEKYLGEISDYGIIGYLIGKFLVFACAIEFLSLPTIMFFVGIGGTTGNIAYGWGILMVFTCLRYFDGESNRLNVTVKKIC